MALPAATGKAAPSGKVFGVLRDEKTNKPVEFAPVAVFSTRDSSVAGGALTDGGGQFRIENIKPGEYYLKVSFIGYREFRSPSFYINFLASERDMAVIKITPAVHVLKDVEVSADKSDYINNIDKKVYNVEKNIVNTGGTATEVLQNIPSVTVDIDGKVSLRGSANVTILVDGKPSGLTGSDRQAVLQQIPAFSIDQIEVITNPSAKYDAEGQAGIINIVTKKDKLKGINGNLALGAGTHDKYNGALGLNNRTSKYNIYTSYNYRHEERYSSGESTQHNLAPSSYTTTSSDGSSRSDFQSGKLGADLYLNNYNTLGLSGTLSRRKESRPESIMYRSLDNEQVLLRSFTRDNYSMDKNNTVEGAFDYKHSFPGTKKELTMSGNYSTNLRNAESHYSNSLFRLNGIPYQLNATDNHFTTSVVQADYTQPVKDKAKFETGAKSTFRTNDNDQNAQGYNSSSGSYVNDARFSNHFIYHEKVYALYTTYTGRFWKFDYSAGLRGEEAMTDGESRTGNAGSFTHNYFSLYPSATLKYKLKSFTDIQLSYSRRVNRPNIYVLNPFVDYSDSLNIRKGNPYLQPEYINSFDLSYTNLVGNLSLSASLFYRHSDNIISMYRSFNGQTGVSTIQFQNFSSSDNIGLEGVARYQAGKIGNIMGSLSAFRNKINAANLETDLQSSSISWNARMFGMIKLFKGTTLQLVGFYLAPIVMPQSTFRGMSGIDAGIKQEIWKGKGSLTLNVTDVFNQRKFYITNDTDIYTYEAFRKRESRVANLTFTYRFGTTESNLFQRKKGQQQAPQMDGSGMEMIGY